MGYTLCVLGCGTMGIAILSGVLASLESRTVQLQFGGGPRPKSGGAITPTASGASTPMPTFMKLDHEETSLPERFIACVNRAESARRLKALFAAQGELAQDVEVVADDNLRAVQEADVVLLCCKPQLAHSILHKEGIREALEGKLLISILAGVTIGQLTDWVSSTTRVIRAMPNTPCKIREGMTVVSTISADQTLDREIVTSIFSSLGRCRILEEKHFDACTALSGSGPAFACIVLEAMADGGVMMGLPRAEALELAAQSLQGAARMALQTGVHPAQIKDAVTTPGGCTIAGLLTLEDGRVRSTIARAIQVATERAAVLGQPTERRSVDSMTRN